MPSNDERIAVLETKVEALQELIDEIKSLRETMTKYKGFIGGIMFTISAVFTALGAVATYWFGRPG